MASFRVKVEGQTVTPCVYYTEKGNFTGAVCLFSSDNVNLHSHLCLKTNHLFEMPPESLKLNTQKQPRRDVFRDFIQSIFKC